jgi:hypothetical protein
MLKFEIRYVIDTHLICLLVCLYHDVSRHFQQYFSYIVAVSFIVGGNRRTP